MLRSRFDRLMERCAYCFSPRRQGIKVVYIRNVEGRRKKRFPIDGIFDSDHERVEMDNGTPVSTVVTQLGIHKKAIPFPPHRGDMVVVGKQKYSIQEAQPDSEFGIILTLKKV